MNNKDFDHDTVSVHMEAPANAIYELVADVTRTPEFSPEILSCKWLDGATGPAVGARFAARNKIHKRPGWTNKPVVTVVDPGKMFAFERTEPFGGTVRWSYEFEPDQAGTKVTESYQVTKKISPVGWFIIGTLFGQKDRTGDLHAGMLETLDRLRAVAERQAASQDAE
jgi:hypothetical protein